MIEIFKSGKWALNEAYFNSMFPLVMNAIRLGHDLVKKKTQLDYLQTIHALLLSEDSLPHPNIHADEVQVKISTDGDTGLPVVKSNGYNIALISVIGPLTKYGELCSMGMQDYQSLLNRANASPNIDGIVLIMDTPGGTVDGTPEFGLAIKSSTKPVGIFGDHMVASAGMWLASQASVIVGNKNNPTEFGSIGVLMALPNYQNVMDAGNFPKVEIFRASQSTDKALVNTIEPITDAARQDLQQQLNDTAANFISTVKAGRGDVLDTKTEGLFSGKMFDVYQAKKAGLIDTVGTLQTAINKVADLARQKKYQTGNTAQKVNANTPMFKSKTLSNIFGKSEKAEEKKPTAEAENNPMEVADQKVSEMEAENASLKAQKEAAEQKAMQLEAKVAELNAQITTLTAKAAEEKAEMQQKIDAKPTGQATTVIVNPEKESNQSTDPEAVKVNSYATSVDAEAKTLRDQQESLKTFK